MSTRDAIIVGGGVIGLSLALRLKERSLKVLIVERREPASEATHAAGGMIARCDAHIPATLLPMVHDSARIYPEFVHEVEAESGERVDLRDTGTLAIFAEDELPSCRDARQIATSEIESIERNLRIFGKAWFLPEQSVDPRALGQALAKAARNCGVDFVTGSTVRELLIAHNRADGVRTEHSAYHAGVVVNCAGAWAAQIGPFPIPTRPVKGQMLCVVPQSGASHNNPLIRHVVRTPEVYIIPRSDGRILLGATVEEAGFDKQTDPEIIKGLFDAGIRVAPVLKNSRIHDAWAGLRPGTPDTLPILGETRLPGYYAATGHFRDGIMLAPITAELMAELITTGQTRLDLSPFTPLRFG